MKRDQRKLRRGQGWKNTREQEGKGENVKGARNKDPLTS